MMETRELLLRLALGAIFGGIIGYERQAHGRPAGFRTHLLVCMASVLLMEVSLYYHFYMEQLDPGIVRVDPGRIAAGAITGVGFLGAGVIVKTGATVQGLTTAACIWMVSAIGLALGGGLYAAGTAAFLVTLFSLTVLRSVENRTSRLIFKSLTLVTEAGFEEKGAMGIIERRRGTIHGVDYERDSTSGEDVYRYTLALRDDVPQKEILDEFAALPGVKKTVLRS